MTATVDKPAPHIARFKASRAQLCASQYECEGVAVGERAGYIGDPDGGPPRVMCAPCLDRLEAAVELDATTHTPETPAAPEGDGWAMTDPEQLVMPSIDQASPADLQPWDGPLCGCTNRQTGFLRDETSGRWVHNECRRPALRYEDGRGAVTPITGPGEVVDDGPAAIPHQPDPTDVVEGGETVESDADRAADAAHAEWVADTEAPGECGCARVTKRAKFHRDDAGRARHDNCGGVVREKHRALAEEYLGDAPTPDEPNPDAHEEAASDDGHDEPAGDTADPDAGQQTGDAAGPVRPGEGGEGPGGEDPQGADGGDQARGEDGQPGLDGHRDPQLVPDDAAAPARGEVDAPGHQADAGRAPAAVQPALEVDPQLEARAAAVGPEAAVAGLAAFFAERFNDGPLGTLADFYAQPADDDERASWGAPVHAVGDSDNYLGEFWIVELADELGRRDEVGGLVVGLIIDDPATGTTRMLAVPR